MFSEIFGEILTKPSCCIQHFDQFNIWAKYFPQSLWDRRKKPRSKSETLKIKRHQTRRSWPWRTYDWSILRGEIVQVKGGTSPIFWSPGQDQAFIMMPTYFEPKKVTFKPSRAQVLRHIITCKRQSPCAFTGQITFEVYFFGSQASEKARPSLVCLGPGPSYGP